MHTIIVDYDSGNLHSALKAFEKMAVETGSGTVSISDRPEDIRRADRLVLPGDGAFPACKRALSQKSGLMEALIERVERDAIPFMGICVGMQLMALMGEEYEPTKGLGWINGRVLPITPNDPALKVPHMGWNTLNITQDHPVLAGLNTGYHVYFVHSFHMKMDARNQLFAYTDHGGEITAIVGQDTKIGLQFHPEKSQKNGLLMIANFMQWAP